MMSKTVVHVKLISGKHAATKAIETYVTFYVSDSKCRKIKIKQ